MSVLVQVLIGWAVVSLAAAAFFVVISARPRAGKDRPAERREGRPDRRAAMSGDRRRGLPDPRPEAVERRIGVRDRRNGVRDRRGSPASV